MTPDEAWEALQVATFGYIADAWMDFYNDALRYYRPLIDAAILADGLRKYHATHLATCLAANPTMTCTCGLNDLLAGSTP